MSYTQTQNKQSPPPPQKKNILPKNQLLGTMYNKHTAPPKKDSRPMDVSNCQNPLFDPPMEGFQPVWRRGA